MENCSRNVASHLYILDLFTMLKYIFRPFFREIIESAMFSLYKMKLRRYMNNRRKSNRILSLLSRVRTMSVRKILSQYL